MNTKAIGIILGVIIIVAAIAAGYVYLTEEEEDIWETETDFGSWEQDIEFMYADGTTMSVRRIIDEPALAVYYDNKEVTGYYYILYATATGTSQDWVTIDRSDYKIQCTGIVGSVYVIEGLGSKDIKTDGVTYKVFEQQVPISYAFPTDTPPGKYVLAFIPQGTLRYKVAGVWQSASLPNMIQLNMEVKDDGGGGGNIIVTFTGEAGGT